MQQSSEAGQRGKGPLGDRVRGITGGGLEMAARGEAAWLKGESGDGGIDSVWGAPERRPGVTVPFGDAICREKPSHGELAGDVKIAAMDCQRLDGRVDATGG